MKFTTVLSTLSIISFSSWAVATPVLSRAAEAGANALAKRAPIDDAYGIVENLYSEIKTHTGSINETAADVSPTSSQQDKDAATSSVGTQLNSITAAVNAAKSQVDALSDTSSTPKLMARQGTSPEALALLIEEILLELSGALNGIIAELGLIPLLSFLSPLVASLSALLLSLEVVVNNLLDLVKQLLDGLLTGLSIGLAGLLL